MPLLNYTIQRLNEITTNVENKNKLSSNDEAIIKQIFNEINKKGELYDVSEIESWFENEGSWKIKGPRVRITNLANYVQDKYQQTAHLRIISDDDCGC